MQGDQADMLLRLKQVLPLRWFPDSTPVLDAILSGSAWAWASCFSLLQVIKAQTRISTAEGCFLDFASQDFFGPDLPRRPGESDPAYCTRIKAELLRERGTRKAVQSVLLDLTGQPPRIFEPANPLDTGGYAGANGTGGGLGYCQAGGWGSLSLPLQFFVTVSRPAGGGIASISGWDCAAGGYGAGALAYTTPSMAPGRIADDDIYQAIIRVLPFGTVAWVRVVS